ncbi:MAG: glutamate-1-semialdehyde 2,1-aminomutase [Bradymonadia bacterium]
MTKSRALLARAEQLLPAGVNSPVRAFRSVGGDPPFIARAQGAWLHDVDGNRYVDYVLSWGPALLGHAHPEVVAAVCSAAGRGMSFGAPTGAEVEIAEALRRFFPSLEMMRLVSSGTEACMAALRLARGATGRDTFIKFEGCYHGHADPFLVKAGSGLATFGIPDSAGVPADVAKHTLTLPFNDADALNALMAREGQRIAAVIVEPVTGNMGVALPTAAFRQALDAVRSQGALLIFDEVMTGFRVSRGGAQQYYGMTPDLTCLAKVAGGGLPLGVYGGRAELMRHVAPLGPVYQAGTLSGNPLATAAGIATLRLLDEPGFFEGVEATTEALCVGIEALAQEAGVPVTVPRVGSMFTVFFGEHTVTNFEDAKRCDMARFGRFHRAMLEAGIYFPASGYEACFVSGAHGPAEVDHTLKAVEVALRR